MSRELLYVLHDIDDGKAWREVRQAVAKKKKRRAPVKKKPVKKKAAIVTRRSTAGTGFDFEDYVSGWLLLQGLAGRQLPIEGQVRQLQAQTGALDWDIDDILLTAQDETEVRHLAVSCKGNVQVTGNGLPKSFGEQAWKLWTKTDSPLSRAADVMALATQGANANFQSAWSDIKEFATGADAPLALAQIAANARYKRIFDGLKASSRQIGVSVSNEDVLSLITHLQVLPFDFRLAVSKDEREAIATARSLLAEGTQRNAKRLWFDIVGRARETRLGSGTLDLAALLRWLRKRFLLKDLPDYERSWTRLRALSAETESLIQMALPSGARLDLVADSDELCRQLGVNPCLAVYGESGTGKSALVKGFLERHFPNAVRVWFAPEHLEQALDEAERIRFGIVHPLIRVLDAAVASENFLIIDAAERLTSPPRVKAQQLVEQLLALNGTETPPPWRVILIGQTEFWASGDLQKIAGTPSPLQQEVGLRSTSEVASVLRASPGLEWLASHHEALLALTNLRTLAWVIQASSVFQSGGPVPASLVTIAEKLWSHWTAGRTALQGFLMRLAVRDAAFEHSVPISTFDPADAKAFDERPQQCPVRRNIANNHVQFEHDLAADWARFQQLKEIAADTARWAAYAENPLWNGALRMLGQFLLRQPSGGRTAWDDAFEAVQAAQGRLPLADDILLDALFLDPAAITFLKERADMLFANNAQHLQRLLARFEHVATVPRVERGNEGPLKDFVIYLEAKFRTPVVGRWPALAAFLNCYQQRVAELTLPRVSQLCERWLTTMPLKKTDETPFPYRREFAELALATARAEQLNIAKGHIYVGDNNSIFQAAFAGAQDIPDEVASWALEMARRRPMRADLAEKQKVYQQEKADEHRRRMEEDASYRERQNRKRGIPTFPSGRRLPPWPLGPQGRVDKRFTEAVLHSATFQRLMRARPAIASEVLLAVLIEDAPEEGYSSRGSYREELGLTYDHESYPTAYWKSPLFLFFQIDPPTALDALLKLTSFCMDRWDHEVERRHGSVLPPVTVRLKDGAERSYRGRYNVFAWSQANDHVNGQLYSALAALERWLCELLEREVDINAYLDDLLHRSESVSILGVLINVGKRLPDLFQTVLKPLVTAGQFYAWDEGRVKNSKYSFDGLTWIRSGQMIFELARDWYAAPYRHKNFVAIVGELCRQDRELGEFVNAAAAQWTLPGDDKERIELQIRVAQLDYRNYRVSRTAESNEERTEFVCPAELAATIGGFQESKRRALEILAFPDNCRRFVAVPVALPQAEIAAIAALMAAADGDEAVDLDEEMIRPARVAAAVVLLLGASDWLTANSTVRDRARAIVNLAMEDTAVENDRSHFRYSMAPSYLEFVAYFVFHEWLLAPSAATDHTVMRILTSGDDRAADVIAKMAYVRRIDLGERWWRLLYLALLWSGLTILKPRLGHEDETSKRQWLRRVRWLLTRRLSGRPSSVDQIRPLELAKRVEQFEAHQWEAEYRREGRQFTRDRSRRMSGALNTHFLEIIFAWLLTDKDLPTDAAELEQRRNLLIALWSHQAWWLVGSESDSSGDYAPMGQFGYKLLDALAAIIPITDVNAAPTLWQPVFDLGPKGHYAIGHFFLCFFSNLAETTDTVTFATHWRPMIEAVMKGQGWDGGPWYHQQSIERQALGFANVDALVRPRQAPLLVESMRDLYRAWAEKRLPGDEDNLAALCNFLSTQAGMPLRMDGLIWIAESMRGDSSGHNWYRDRTSAAFVEFLNAVITSDNSEAVAKLETRKALIDLIGLAVSRQLPAALALQDRLKALL
jgi:hypothetical protein